MFELKVGIQLACLKQPFKKALHTAARLGADAVEIDARGEIHPQVMTRTAVRQVRKLLDDHDLRVCAVSFQTRRGYNDPDQLDRRMEATRQAMRLAFDLGAPVVTNYIGHIPAEPQGIEWELLVQTLSDLGRHGQRIGSFLAARTGPTDPAQLNQLMTALPAGSLVVDLDPGGLVVHGYSVADATRLLSAHVMHVRARDAVRDLAQGRGLEVPLGRGSVDFPEILGILEEHEYRGCLTIQREPSENSLEEISQAVQFLRSLMN